MHVSHIVQFSPTFVDASLELAVQGSLLVQLLLNVLEGFGSSSLPLRSHAFRVLQSYLQQLQIQSAGSAGYAARHLQFFRQFLNRLVRSSLVSGGLLKGHACPIAIELEGLLVVQQFFLQHVHLALQLLSLTNRGNRLRSQDRLV